MQISFLGSTRHTTGFQDKLCPVVLGSTAPQTARTAEIGCELVVAALAAPKNV